MSMKTVSKSLEFEARNRARSIYNTSEQRPKNSLLHWDEQPFTADGYVGDGSCLTMGILGRNKGLQPKNLAFDMSRAVSTSMEDFGTSPLHPNKVLRSYYMSTLKAQYGGLGQGYVDAATELALLLVEVPPEAVAAWLKAGMEHQSVKWNDEIAEAGIRSRLGQDEIRR